MKLLISRIDRIGDVVLTLPMAGFLKHWNPNIKIFFLGTKYTKDLILSCKYIDYFVDLADLLNNPNPKKFLEDFKLDSIIHVFPNKQISYLAKKARIPIRIGTNRRLFHLFSCNRLVNLTRKNSELHEAQLNLQLLKGLFGLKDIYIPLNIDLIKKREISFLYGIVPNKISEKCEALRFYNPRKINLIIHPKSAGHGQEWDAKKFEELLKLLPQKNFNIFLTGSVSEKQYIEKIELTDNTFNIAGMLEHLSDLIAFIFLCDGLIASGTGPLHLAAALNKKTFGLFPQTRHIGIGRWGALGLSASNYSINISPNSLAKEVLKTFKL